MAQRKSDVPVNEIPRHRALAEFWKAHSALPADIRARAKKQFDLLAVDPQHPSLHFKKLTERRGDEIWSARVTLSYRALAFKRPDGYVWFWIGPHKAYDALLSA